MIFITRLLFNLSLALLLCVLASTGIAAAEEDVTPEQALKKYGSISVTFGGSYYSFEKDGSFISRPCGISGRALDGYWVLDKDGRYVATVRMSWLNGAQPPENYSRLVFQFSSLYKTETRLGIRPKMTLVDGYYYIEEFKNIDKPDKEIPKYTARQ